MPEIRPDLLLRETAWLSRLASSLVGSQQAEDLVQGTMLRALRHAGRQVRSPRAWLTRIARNLAHSMGVREHRRAAIEGGAGREAHAPPTHEVVARASVHRALVEAVLELEDPYRTSVLLRYLEDLSLEQVAALTDVPLETARTRIKRGLVILRARLAGRHDLRVCLAPFGLAASTWTTTAGVSVMSAKAKVAVFAAVLVVAVTFWQLFPASPEELPSPSSTGSVASTDRGVLEDASGSEVERTPVVDPPAVQTPSPPAEPKAWLHGVLLDEESRAPVVGARIDLVDRGAQDTLDEVPTVSTRTDPFGSFRVATARRLLMQPYRAEVVAEAEGYARLRHVLREALTREAEVLEVGELTLPPGTGVHGFVVGADATPVAGAALLVGEDWVFVEDAGRLLRGDRLLPASESAGDGSFTLTHRLTGSHPDPLLLAVAEEGLGWSRVAARRSRQEIGDLVVELRPAGRLEVRVEGPAGEPVARATVRVRPRFAPFGNALHAVGLYPRRGPLADFLERRTDEQGIARFLALPGDGDDRTYAVQVEAEGQRRLVQEGIAVRAGSQTSTTLSLQSGSPHTVTGHVRDPSGRPIAGALVRVDFGSTASGSSDAEGRYRIEGLSGGVDLLQIRAAAAGHVPELRYEEVDGREDVLTLDFALEPAGTIFGIVVDQHGVPVAEAGILCDPGRRHAVTDREGRFRIADLPRGDIELWVEPPQPAQEWRGDVFHTATAGDSPVLLVLHRRVGGRIAVEVEVVDRATGGSREPLLAMFYRRDGDGDETTVRPKLELGRIVAADLTPGRWELDADIADGPPVLVPFELRADQERVRRRVEVGSGADLRVAVRLDLPPDVPPPARLQVGFVYRGNRGTLEPLPGGVLLEAGELTATLDPSYAEAGFAVRKADPSRPLEMRVFTDGFTGRLVADLVEGTERTAELVVRRAGWVSFTSERPFPHRGFSLALKAGDRPWDEPFWIAETHGASALFRLSLPPGPLQWRAELPSRGASNRGGGTVLEGRVEVRAGREVRVPILR